MKIDPKLKNRLRFNQLEPDARDRLRRFYHLTSAEAALRIVQSGFIWSDTPELCPHFTPNKTRKPEDGTEPEVCLRFQFSGPAHLVPEEALPAGYVPNALYVHLYEWPDMFGLQGMRVAQLRVSAPCTSGLECIGFTPSPAFLDQCKNDIQATLLLTALKRMTAMSRSVQVPQDAAQRAAIEARFPPPRFGTWDVLQMRWQLWRRRMAKPATA
ncbi:MAG: hypothetical protein HXX19_14235 [Rhodoferax sp.]|nr:hypothetical protein [Rhodoferax sp.]